MLMSEEEPVFGTFRDSAGGWDQLYAHLREAASRSALEHFNVVRTTTLTNGRILFHLEKR
jgi:hypothetical protein